jgi:hypothetical protein
VYYEELGELIYDDEIFERLVFEGIESIYLVSSYGRVWSLKHKKYLAYNYGRDGRRRVHLYLNGKSRTIELARVIALTFLGPGEGLEADHIDNDPLNDILDNIQWLTPYENKSKAHKTGSIQYNIKRGEESGNSMYSEKDIHTVCKLMEEGKEAKYISSVTNIPITTIYSISHKEKWTHISMNYKIDNIGKSKHYKVSKEVGEFVNKKIIEGFTNREIEQMLKNEYDIISGYNIVSNRRRRLKEKGII